MLYEASFSKENLDRYLRELSKEYRKQNGTSSKAEIILIGGAAVLIGYGFREMTTDIDAIIRQSEKENKSILLEYQAEKNGVLSQDNVHEVIQAIKKRKGQEI